MKILKKDKFRLKLKQQLEFIERSCQLFDTGLLDEAIRIATCIRVILYDTKNSKSILSHLESKNIKLFTSSSPLPIMTEHSEACFLFSLGVMFGGGKFGGSGYGPNLQNFSESQKTITVDEWWNQIVFILGKNIKLSRKDIVLTASNKDGGAHVDEQLPPEYERLKNYSFGTCITKKGNKEYRSPIINMHFISIRTMANELLKSPELIKLANEQNFLE